MVVSFPLRWRMKTYPPRFLKPLKSFLISYELKVLVVQLEELAERKPHTAVMVINMPILLRKNVPPLFFATEFRISIAPCIFDIYSGE